MKVILLDENRVAEVSEGHARNYLFPQKLAILATPVNMAKFEKRLTEKAAEIAEQKKSAQALAEKLASFVVGIKAEAGEEGKLFGSVTSQDIVEAIKEQQGLEIDKKKVNLNEHIGSVGEYSASVKLHHEVVGHIKINVEKK